VFTKPELNPIDTGPPSAPSAPHMTPSYGSSVNHGRGNNSDTGSAHAPSRGW